MPDAVATLGANGELSVGQASYVMREGDATALWVIPQAVMTISATLSATMSTATTIATHRCDAAG